MLTTVLLAVDIGNSAIKFGVFDGETLVARFSIPTKLSCSSAEIENRARQLPTLAVSKAVACSVVPEADDAIREFVSYAFGTEIEFLKNDFDFRLKIDYRPLSSLGTDRLVNAFAAVNKYGKPCIVCSLGTATTIDAVNAEGEFLGGIIAPGMQTMARALHQATAKLPEVEVSKPHSLIGNSTESSIRSGIFYGYAALVEGLIERFSAEVAAKPKTIATGGFAQLMARECKAIDVVDENLTLDGLRLAAGRRT